ncbi:MAG: alpha/beta fold hydrolase, partial [Myxococcota bacterium]
DISAVAALLREGVDVWLCDFGIPEEEEGGMDRTLDDHVRAVSECIDFITDATEQSVHLAGYSQGGMFCYQVAAWRRSRGLASVITFGSPVDIRRNLPNVDEGVAQQLIRMAEAVISRPLAQVDGLPGMFTSTGFKLMSFRKEAGQLVDFVRKLHDRQALEKRESRRLFLGGEGFVAWPGPALRKFVDEFIVHNRMLSGGFVIDGRTVTLADIRCPVLYFVGLRDDIARPASVQAVQRAIPHAELFEADVPAGHFGLVVGSKSLTMTWPTVIEWIRWREEAGPRPALITDEDAQEPLEDPEVAGFEEIDVDVRLFVDAISDVAGSLWNRLGQIADDVGDAFNGLRYQLPRLNELERLDGDTQVGMGAALAKRAAETPDRTFFLWRSRAFTYAQADQRVDAVVRGFLSLGVRPEQRVGVWMGSRPSMLTVVTALNRIGAVAVLLRAGDSEENLRASMGLCEISALVTEPEQAESARGVVDVPVWVLGGGRDRSVAVPGVVDMEQIDPAAVTLPPDYRPNAGRARDLALVLFTGSGEGIRAARITNGRWAFSALGAAAASTLTLEDTVYAALPLHHAAGILVSVGSALVSGCRFALADAIEGGGFPKRLGDDPAPFWSEVRRYGATVVFYAGEMCRTLVDAPFSPSDRLTPVRLFAGSGMRPSTWREITDRFDAGVLEFYASTESSAVLANASGEKVGAVGRPLPGSAEMALVRYDFAARTFVRDERGFMVLCEADEPGVLLAEINETHPSHAEPRSTRILRNAFVTGDRWWSSNDVLRRDESGDLAYLGRVRDAVVRDGSPFFTRPPADAVDALPQVSLAIGHLRDGVPTVTVSLRDPVAPEDYHDALAGLPLPQWPAQIVVAERIPMTEGFRPIVSAIEAPVAYRLVDGAYVKAE